MPIPRFGRRTSSRLEQPNPVLDIRQLSAGYGPMRILHEIDLAVGAGERVGLVGLNGHGKTTLMRAIMGLVDWRRGEIRVFGRSIMKTPTHRLVRDGVVMIPQGDEQLFPGLTVLENLDAGAFSRRTWPLRTRRREAVLHLFPPLGARLRQPAGTLSGGERRMLSVGRGLMSDARLYLIDEPSLGLSIGLARGLITTLLSVDLQGGAMLIAEQNRDLIEGKLERIVRLHAGQVKEDRGGNHKPRSNEARG